MKVTPVKGLALAHTLATRESIGSNVKMATAQEALIHLSIAKRSLGGPIQRPARDLSLTKLARAKALFTENSGCVARNQMIDMFVSELGLTRAGATTYYSRIRGE